MNRVVIILLIVMSTSSYGFSQAVDRGRFEPVYNFVVQAGPLEDYLLKDIIDTFRRQKFDEMAMTYAIYTWIGRNVDYDCHSFHHRKQANTSASAALQNRRALGAGYANLFKAMCDLARIECAVIEGHAKTTPDGIGVMDDRQLHSWNAVKIRNTWYYIDAAWGAGYTDLKRKVFTKEFTDSWFFTNRDLFSLSHFPDNKKWHFEDVPFIKPQYMNAPVINSGAILFEVFPSDDLKGRIRAKEKTCKPVVFELRKPQLIRKVEVAINGVTTPAEYTIHENEMLVELPFNRRGNYFVSVLVNNKPAYQFKAEVNRE